MHLLIQIMLLSIGGQCSILTFWIFRLFWHTGLISHFFIIPFILHLHVCLDLFVLYSNVIINYQFYSSIANTML